MTKKEENVHSHLMINEKINFSQVLLVYKEKKIIIDKEGALKLAKEVDLDLVCVATPSNMPPVCKIFNYKKYIFDLSKKKKSKKSVYKEKKINISFKIEPNDLKNKLELIKKIVSKGQTVKVVLSTKGKERRSDEEAREKCRQIVEELQNKSPYISLKNDVKATPHGNNYFFLICKKNI